MKKITLINKDNTLYLPSEPNDKVLIYFYDQGDVDTIRADKPNMDHLFSALYGEREMGNIPSDTETVYLPCGKEIDMSNLA